MSQAKAVFHSGVHCRICRAVQSKRTSVRLSQVLLQEYSSNVPPGLKPKVQKLAVYIHRGSHHTPPRKKVMVVVGAHVYFRGEQTTFIF